MSAIVEKTQVGSVHAIRPCDELLLNELRDNFQVLQFMVEEKLPKEIAAKKSELQIYEDVINERVINSQYMANLQSRIDKVAEEIKQIVESRVVERDADNLLPFRQQAATVMRIKDTAAEQLDDLTKSIRELDANVARKQAVLQQRIGETYLRGDDLKQYVNMLKAKSSVYKKQRAELSALEVNALTAIALVSLKLHLFLFAFSDRTKRFGVDAGKIESAISIVVHSGR